MHFSDAQDLRDIELDGVLADAQFTGDLIVGQALDDQQGDLQLAWRELFEVRSGRQLCDVPQIGLGRLLLDFVDVQAKFFDGGGESLQTLLDAAQVAGLAAPVELLAEALRARQYLCQV
ncbi:hypothetical protein D3C81_1595640 [compost metagenome]